MSNDHVAAPDWAAWNANPALTAWTVGIEEEVMLLAPGSLALASRVPEVLLALPPDLSPHARAETHQATLEIATDPHATVAAAVAQLYRLRRRVAGELDSLGLRVAAAGTHPFAGWKDVQVSDGARYRFVHESMRELARREPTFAAHIHVGVPAAELAVRVANRLRAHLPALLALSASSPFWQGRDSGMASVRTSIFQGFPRVGLPRAFPDYGAWVRTVDALIAPGAIPEPTFLWWDVRLQPRLGTVEVRIMDAQSTVDRTAALAALVQSLARLETEDDHPPAALLTPSEVLDENRFLAARDGVEAELIDPVGGGWVPVRAVVADLLAACRSHARDLDCEPELELVAHLVDLPAAELHRRWARDAGGTTGLTEALADCFLDPPSSMHPAAWELVGAIENRQT